MNITTNRLNGLPINRQLGAANAAQAKSVRNIASGKRVNRAADDASGLAVLRRLIAQSTGSSVAGQNTQDAISMVRTADGVLGSVGETTTRMAELAARAGNGTLSSDERQSLQAEFDQLAQEIDRVGQSTTFNGKKLFDGSTLDMQVGVNAQDRMSVKMGEVSSSALGLDGVDLTSAEGAGRAMQSIRGASQALSAQRGAMGAAENGMKSAYNNLNSYEENLAASISRIGDADIGRESMNRSIADVLQNTSIALMGRSRNLMQYNALQLLMR